MEVAHVEQTELELMACGTQLGSRMSCDIGSSKERPSLEVSTSEQRYEPLGGGVIRFCAGDFVSDITFDADGFVVNYPGIGARA